MKTSYFLKRFISDYWWFYHASRGDNLKSVRYAYQNCASNIECYLTKVQIKYLYKKINEWLILSNAK